MTTNVYLIRRPRKQSGRVDHFWMLRYADSNGKTRYKSLGKDGVLSRTQASKARDEFIKGLGSGAVTRDKAAKLTVSQFLEQDRESMASASKPATLVTHRQASDHLAAAIGGDTPLSKLDWKMVGKLRNWMTSEHTLNGRTLKPCSKATVRKTLATLKAVWNRGIQRKLVVTNPFTEEKMPRTQSKGKRIYTTKEVGAMVEAAPDLWWRTFVRLAFTTGLRVGELLNLTWSDIQDGHVVVSAKRCGTFTVDGVTYPMLPWSCKNHSERRVPLHPDAAVLLDELHLRSSGPYVFLSLPRLLGLKAKRDVTKEIPAAFLVNNMRRTFLALQTAARDILAERRGEQVDWPVGTMHDLRKSYATLMASKVPMHELQRLMGHESITTTAKHYTEASDNVVEAVRLVFAA